MTDSMVDYFLVCEGTTLDKKNRVSLVNIYDTIEVKKFPVRPDEFTVAFSLLLDSKIVLQESELKITFTKKSSGKEVYSATTSIGAYESSDKYDVVKLTSKLEASGDIEFNEAGFYVYRLYINKVQMACNEFRVREEK